EPSGANGWYTGGVVVTATATDDSAGDVGIEYRVAGGDWSPYTGAVDLAADGSQAVDFRATDAAGNVSQVESVQVDIDSTAPEVSLEGVADGDALQEGVELVVQATGADTGSGLTEVVLSLDGEQVDNPATLTPAVGSHELVAVATDAAGNTAQVTAAFEVTAAPATFTDVRDQVDAMYEEGQIHVSVWRQVNNHLSSAQRFIDRGQLGQGEAALDRAIAAAGGVGDGEVREELVELLDGLRHHFQD
ncbi:hypothetical protein PU560_07240, partial [Georgenia sp. 10Sc9-8]|nr:hypothetical protein [Georgenia halotolerans]